MHTGVELRSSSKILHKPHKPRQNRSLNSKPSSNAGAGDASYRRQDKCDTWTSGQHSAKGQDVIPIYVVLWVWDSGFVIFSGALLPLLLLVLLITACYFTTSWANATRSPPLTDLLVNFVCADRLGHAAHDHQVHHRSSGSSCKDLLLHRQHMTT